MYRRATVETGQQMAHMGLDECTVKEEKDTVAIIWEALRSCTFQFLFQCFALVSSLCVSLSPLGADPAGWL